jgi:hypothetical protein
MRRMFRPVVTVLEGRRLLSFVSHHISSRTLIEVNAHLGAQSISGTLNGHYYYVTPPGGAPSSYSIEFRLTGGQLNMVQLGGAGTITDSTSHFYRSGSGFDLGKYEGYSFGSSSWSEKINHLSIAVLDAPFAPSSRAPNTFDVRVRVKSASGVFKHDVGKRVSLAVVLSSEPDDSGFKDFVATVQPAGT